MCHQKYLKTLSEKPFTDESGATNSNEYLMDNGIKESKRVEMLELSV
jgi:hypothetical protein